MVPNRMDAPIKASIVRTSDKAPKTNVIIKTPAPIITALPIRLFIFEQSMV